MLEFYMILARKKYQNTRTFMIFARKMNKIHESYMIFCRIITARKIFFPNFVGEGHVPPAPPRLLRLWVYQSANSHPSK